MAFTRPLAGRWALLFFCAASMIAIPATDAFAVAGKFTSAPPGAALSGGELTLELNEPVNASGSRAGQYQELPVPERQRGNDFISMRWVFGIRWSSRRRWNGFYHVGIIRAGIYRTDHRRRLGHRDRCHSGDLPF
jgi:hypothetical protein